VTGSAASGTYRIDVNGLEREFNIKLPANYDPKVPYRLVFAWHWLTGTAARVQSAGYYGLESRSAGTTIFAAGQGLDSNGDMEYGWPDSNGRDVAFARALLDWIRTRYCIDNARIFSTGWSYGGMFSNRLGCVMGDVFRAIAPMSGNGPPRSNCVGQVAAWISHGDQDPTVSLSSGQGSRDHWAAANHCTMDTMPTDPSPCVAYQGCDSGFPVHWCVFPGGHTQPSFGSSAIWNFFSQF
jgi:poly(3-hydroxybutyrate) depolymerase